MNKKIFLIFFVLLGFFLLSRMEQETKFEPIKSVLQTEDDESELKPQTNERRSDNKTVENPELIKGVRSALSRFDETLSTITKEDLEEEQERMRQSRERFAKIIVESPEQSVVVDKRGVKWIKLTYSSGAVRYEFLEN